MNPESAYRDVIGVDIKPVSEGRIAEDDDLWASD